MLVRTYLDPLTDSVSLTLLEEFLIVRNAVLAVDEAITEMSSALVFRGEMRPFRDRQIAPIRAAQT